MSDEKPRKPRKPSAQKPVEPTRFISYRGTGLGSYGGITFEFTIGGPTPDTTALRERVTADLESIVAGMTDFGPAPAECPSPPPDMTDTYAVAFRSAARRCDHPNSVSTLYARRERQCLDCGRYFTRREMYE